MGAWPITGAPTAEPKRGGLRACPWCGQRGVAGLVDAGPDGQSVAVACCPRRCGGAEFWVSFIAGDRAAAEAALDMAGRLWGARKGA